MDNTYFIIYIIIAVIISLYITFSGKNKNKIITFFIVLWITSGSVFNLDMLIIKIPGLPFELQYNKIMCLCFLIWLLYSKTKKEIMIVPKFEKYLYLYLVFVIFSLVSNINIVGYKDLIVKVMAILTIIIIYLVLKRISDIETIKIVGKAFIITCILSSVIGIYQFFIDSYFFKVASLIQAFSGKLRSTGIFYSEYFQSYFLICGIFWTLYIVPKKIYRLILIVLFSVGIFLTFHRMSWIVMILTIGVYLNKTNSLETIKGIFKVTYVFLLIFMVGTLLISEIPDLSKYDFVRKRLFADTITGRNEQYEMVIDNIPNKILTGYGSKRSSVYYLNMLRIGGIKWAQGTGGAIHNGYLSVLFFNGLPTMIVLICFLISAMIYFNRAIKNSSFFYVIPLCVVILFIVSNFTNDLSMESPLGILLAIHIGLNKNIK